MIDFLPRLYTVKRNWEKNIKEEIERMNLKYTSLSVLRVTELNSFNCSYFGNNSRYSANISVVLIHSDRFIQTLCAVYVAAKISIDLRNNSMRGIPPASYIFSLLLQFPLSFCVKKIHCRRINTSTLNCRS